MKIRSSTHTYSYVELSILATAAGATSTESAYNDLFRQELERLLSRLTDPTQRQHAETMLDFDWTRYIAGAIRRSAGITNQDEIDEKVHEIVIRMLVSPGGLFRDYDERRHGPFPFEVQKDTGQSAQEL